MTLDEAIKIGVVMQKEQVYLLNPDGDDALLLLIEASKRLQEARAWSPLFGQPLLPGETLK